MSEWKWCGDCGHRFDSHTAPKDSPPDVWYGKCNVTNSDVPDGCPCTAFYMVDTP